MKKIWKLLALTVFLFSLFMTCMTCHAATVGKKPQKPKITSADILCKTETLTTYTKEKLEKKSDMWEEVISYEQSDEVLEKLMDSSVFASGSYRYQVRVITEDKITRTYTWNQKTVDVRTDRKVRYYLRLGYLFLDAPQQAVALLEKAGIRLKVDETMDSPSRLDLKKGILTIREITPTVYKRLGFLVANVNRIEKDDEWKHIFAAEKDTAYFYHAQASNPKVDFFTSAFYLYCADKEQLQSNAPKTYKYIERILKEDES